MWIDPKVAFCLRSATASGCSPPRGDLRAPRVDELRRRWGIFYESHFYAWVLRDPPRKAAIEKRYNAAFRGFVPREYSGEPLDIARWVPDITLAPHQAAGARRVLARVFAVDVTVCSKCGGRMKVLKIVTDPNAIAKLHHGARAPPRTRRLAEIPD